MNNYKVLDIETNCQEQCGRTASPWCNEIVLAVLKGTEDPVIFDYPSQKDILQQVGPDQTLVAFNAKFECLYLWEEMQEFLQKGGKIYCPQLAEYFLSSFQVQWAGLRDVAVNRYGCIPRTKYMEYYWDQGLDTADIPAELVLEDCQNDVLDTEQVYIGQQTLVEARGKVFQNLLDVQMDFLLATTEMEYNGLYIDSDVLDQNRQELQEQLDQDQQALDALVKKYWVGESLPEFNIKSPVHLSLILYGGEIEVPSIEPVLEDGMPVLIKSGANKGNVKVKKVMKKTRVKGMGLNATDEMKTKKEGIYQCNEEIISLIAGA
jgi:DNA polymerase I-like protein with 3'-5' exonuclease and polymerase domains